MANRKSYGGWLFVVVLLAAGGGGVWWWRSQRPTTSEIEYRTAVVGRGDIIQSVTANGQLTPFISVDVGSQVSGNILKLYADFNSNVTNGQLIAELDAATYEARVIQAESELANAKAQNTLAKVNARRSEKLLADKLLAESEYEQTMANLEQSEAMMKIRAASLKSAQVDLARTKIYSPIDGKVISRNMNVGQTVQASFSAPTLFQIANDLTQMQIGALVSEADIGGVEEGQQVTFTVEAFPQRTFRGRVAQVRNQPTTNQNVVNYATMIDVRNEDMKLKPGMTANVSITTAKKENVVRVQNSGLRFRPPTGAVILGAPEEPAGAKPKVELATSGPFAGLPIPPWQAGGERRRPTDEERAAYESSLTADQKAQYQQIMAEMRARFAQGGGGGGGGGGTGSGGGGGGGERVRRSDPERPRTTTVYMLEKETLPAGGERTVLKPVTVKLGISDGMNTEVTEGLKEGDVIVVGTVTAAAATSATNPLGSPFGGMGRR
ncbi:MAG: efflux RND transporter periplasmic adaptor subunit [Verrucomicrobiales bacterium]|nr:efflux RND transporter periplasmic adaptor subunit [Verrucomicrobiales bacterium]